MKCKMRSPRCHDFGHLLEMVWAERKIEYLEHVGMMAGVEGQQWIIRRPVPHNHLRVVGAAQKTCPTKPIK